MIIGTTAHRNTPTRGSARLGILTCTAAILGLVGPARPAHAQTQTDVAELTQLSLEDLMRIDVTSVSKRPQPMSETAAAIYVLTTEDIRRSGATTIPEALRNVPGLHVGQIDSTKWSVAVRGFGGRFSNKLLVLVDGRSVYSPLFSGVFWNLVDVPLEDIERIEVIRGPGAVLWGANAVNGVINIITRSAAATKGAHFTASSGNADRAAGSFRYGGTIGAHTSFRVDVGGLQHETSPELASSRSDGSVGRVGFRADWRPRESDEISIQSAFTSSHAEDRLLSPVFVAPYMASGLYRSRYDAGFVKAVWTRRSTRGETSVQLLEERVVMREQMVEDHQNTSGAEVQRTQKIGRLQQLVMGGTLRATTDRATAATTVRMIPATRTAYLWSGFIQDEVRTPSDRLRVTVGGKLEHNSYTGWEPQPNIRANLTVHGRQSLWGAVSRAVRLPSRADADAAVLSMVLAPSLQSPLPQALVAQRAGAPTVAEQLIAYEGGYRAVASPRLSFDASTFMNDYRHLMTSALGTPSFVPSPVPHVEVPLLITNSVSKSLAGFELATEWRPTAGLRLNGSYGRLVCLRSSEKGLEVTTDDYPEHQAQVRSAINLPRNIEADVAVRYVGALAVSKVPHYVTADARLGLRLGRVNVSVIGRNLFAPAHQEFLPDVILTTGVSAKRSGTLRVQWQF